MSSTRKAENLTMKRQEDVKVTPRIMGSDRQLSSKEIRVNHADLEHFIHVDERSDSVNGIILSENEFGN